MTASAAAGSPATVTRWFSRSMAKEVPGRLAFSALSIVPAQCEQVISSTLKTVPWTVLWAASVVDWVLQPHMAVSPLQEDDGTLVLTTVGRSSKNFGPAFVNVVK